MAIQARCLLGYPNVAIPQVSTAVNTPVASMVIPTYSGGSWNASFPLSNIAKGELYYPIRSTDCLAASTKFTITFQQSRPIMVVALIRHNLTPRNDGSVTWRFTLRDVFGAQLYRSAWLNPYQAFYAPASLPWGWDPAALTGVPTPQDLVKYRSLVALGVTDQLYSAYSIDYEIVDTANPMGFVQIGLPWCSPGYQPLINMSVGASIGWVDPSSRRRTDAGVLVARKRAKYRAASFVLDDLSIDQGMELPFEMDALLGTTEKLMFVMDPTTLYHMHRWSFYGVLSELSPIEFPYSTYTRKAIKVEEAL